MRGRSVINVLVMLAAVLTSLAIPAAPSDEASLLTVEWVACTDAADPRPFFTVEVTQDGLVRYVAGDEVRQKDERSERVSSARARKIFRLADRLLQAHRDGRVKPLQSDVDAYHQYCLRIGSDPTGRTAGTASRATAGLPPRSAKSWIRFSTRRRSWPIPIVQLVEKGTRGERQFSFSLNELDVCVFRHEVSIFADGRGVYYVYGERADFRISS